VRADAFGLAAALGDEAICQCFDVRLQGSTVIFDMAVEMEVNLMKHMAGHGSYLSSTNRVEAGFDLDYRPFSHQLKLVADHGSA